MKYSSWHFYMRICLSFASNVNDNVHLCIVTFIPYFEKEHARRISPLLWIEGGNPLTLHYLLEVLSEGKVGNTRNQIY